MVISPRKAEKRDRHHISYFLTASFMVLAHVLSVRGKAGQAPYILFFDSIVHGLGSGEKLDRHHISYFLTASFMVLAHVLSVSLGRTLSAGVFRGRPRGPGVKRRWVCCSSAAVNASVPSGRPV